MHYYTGRVRKACSCRRFADGYRSSSQLFIFAPQQFEVRMKASLLSCFTLSVFFCTNLAISQEPSELRLSGDLSVNVPAGWKVSAQSADSIEIHVPLIKERKFAGAGEEKEVKPRFVVSSEAGMLITREHRRDHAEAVRRLAEIASEYPEPVTTLVIAGWPAIERRYRSVMPQPGDPEEEASHGNIITSFTTTAVAVDNSVVRFETMLAPDADPKLLDQALAMARNLRAPAGPAENSQRELDQVKKLIRPPRVPIQAPPEPPKELGPAARERPHRPGHSGPGVAVQVQSGLGELEVATNDGQHVVMAANSGFSFSDNFAATWTFGGGTPCNQAACDGDASLSVGDR